MKLNPSNFGAAQRFYADWPWLKSIVPAPVCVFPAPERITCGCGLRFNATQFAALPSPPNGERQETETEDGRPAVLILRNCKCGSTIGREVAL